MAGPAAMAMKILVLEDEPMLLMLAVDIVEEAGFEAVEARNADEAIIVLQGDEDISILWTDIDMPGSMNGLMLGHRSQTLAAHRNPHFLRYQVPGKFRHIRPRGVLFQALRYS
jgi:CheY-like chemotaxis protein